MALVAKTNIVHGKDDGSIIEIAAGEEPKGLPKEALEDLKAAGIIGEPEETPAEVVEENEELQQENAELQQQVEALKAQLAEAQKTPTTGDKK